MATPTERKGPVPRFLEYLSIRTVSSEGSSGSYQQVCCVLNYKTYKRSDIGIRSAPTGCVDTSKKVRQRERDGRSDWSATVC